MAINLVRPAGSRFFNDWPIQAGEGKKQILPHSRMYPSFFFSLWSVLFPCQLAKACLFLTNRFARFSAACWFEFHSDMPLLLLLEFWQKDNGVTKFRFQSNILAFHLLSKQLRLLDPASCLFLNHSVLLACMNHICWTIYSQCQVHVLILDSCKNISV